MTGTRANDRAGAPTRTGPLTHLTVLDLTLARAGPTCVRQLADWGADVIRIEPPVAGTDLSGGERHGPDFQNLHRNKRAMTLNLKSDEGLAVFFSLVERADVVVENMRANVKHRLGVDYEACSARNPGVVYASLSGFGQDGPYGARAGVDQIAQGLGGLMSVTGLPGQGPVRVGIPIADLSAGIYLALGVLLAVIERDRPGGSGRGQWVHTSLLEAQIAMLDFQATRWTMTGEVPPQAGNHHPTGIPMGTFPSADGLVNIAAPGGAKWRTFCRLVGAAHLVDDPDYASASLRSANRDRLNTTIGEYTSAEPTGHWVEVLNDAGIPCGPVLTIDQTFADPQVVHLGLATSVDHPDLGSIDIIRNAVNLTGTPGRIDRPAPDRGQHTDEILTEIGYGADQIDRLHRAGAV
ncbi:MAG: CaiB/BaiF CoA transferase family protein [Acidimicrobiales bacterium]